MLTNQPTPRPTNKLTAATVAAAAVQLAADVFTWITGDDVPVEIVGPLTVLATFAAGYVVKDRTNVAA